MDPIMIPDRPALGAFANQVAARRKTAHRMMRMSLEDFGARRKALTDLVLVHEATRCGRRLDLVACDLRSLAMQFDLVRQPRTGGWPIRVKV